MQLFEPTYNMFISLIICKSRNLFDDEWCSGGKKKRCLWIGFFDKVYDSDVLASNLLSSPLLRSTPDLRSGI